MTENKRIAEAERSSNERGKFNKELNMCKVITDNGHFVEYLREKNRTDGTYDIRIDGTPTDLKCITGDTGNMVKYAKKQCKSRGQKLSYLRFHHMNLSTMKHWENLEESAAEGSAQ